MEISDVAVLEVPDAGGTALVVIVDTDEGVTGIGEAGVRSRPRAVKGALADLRPLLVGADPLRSEHLWQVMFRAGFFPGDRIMGAAIAAVDIALWDIKGRALGVPVHELLGARCASASRVTRTSGRRPATRTRSWRTAGRGIAEGWRHLRCRRARTRATVLEPRPGGARRGSAVARRCARRSATTSSCCSTSTRGSTRPTRRCSAASSSRVRPFFVEDPLRAEAPDAYAALRARTGVPLAAGEQYALQVGVPCAARPRPDRLLPRGHLHRGRLHRAAQDRGLVRGAPRADGDAQPARRRGRPPPRASSTSRARTSGSASWRSSPDAASPFFDGAPEVADGALVPSNRARAGIELDRDAALAARPPRHRAPAAPGRRRASPTGDPGAQRPNCRLGQRPGSSGRR